MTTTTTDVIASPFTLLRAVLTRIITLVGDVFYLLVSIFQRATGLAEDTAELLLRNFIALLLIAGIVLGWLAFVERQQQRQGGPVGPITRTGTGLVESVQQVVGQGKKNVQQAVEKGKKKA
ncbi:uncharacterized protein K452DRAFT_321646 [Aplosporella prunicola CBS 121167]|uniref:Uncharacterized protein n=1 Tax=Aplosporella prunicola CBS 121167 TaxID=1176127 RepID=A0A6A6B2X1_9PEZI|nr:uncharacterized protein K452DRAFT_321646 [Aplosporella prunicola CBS 121167]KAF2137595.1 hypothetical protein K452DRAFT_321646 [Aplosporella prunicola CBS 121167]